MTLRFKDNINHIVDKFKEDYYTFYFNSWEHDLYNNPLESLIWILGGYVYAGPIISRKIKQDNRVCSVVLLSKKLVVAFLNFMKNVVLLYLH